MQLTTLSFGSALGLTVSGELDGQAQDTEFSDFVFLISDLEATPQPLNASAKKPPQGTAEIDATPLQPLDDLTDQTNTETTEFPTIVPTADPAPHRQSLAPNAKNPELVVQLGPSKNHGKVLKTVYHPAISLNSEPTVAKVDATRDIPEIVLPRDVRQSVTTTRGPELDVAAGFAKSEDTPKGAGSHVPSKGTEAAELTRSKTVSSIETLESVARANIDTSTPKPAYSTDALKAPLVSLKPTQRNSDGFQTEHTEGATELRMPPQDMPAPRPSKLPHTPPAQISPPQNAIASPPQPMVVHADEDTRLNERTSTPKTAPEYRNRADTASQQPLPPPSALAERAQVDVAQRKRPTHALYQGQVLTEPAVATLGLPLKLDLNLSNAAVSVTAADTYRPPGPPVPTQQFHEQVATLTQLKRPGYALEVTTKASDINVSLSIDSETHQTLLQANRAALVDDVRKLGFETVTLTFSSQTGSEKQSFSYPKDVSNTAEQDPPAAEDAVTIVEKYVKKTLLDMRL